MHLDDLVRGQETVADALLERIGVHGRAKVVDVGNVGGFSGRGGHAHLGCRNKKGKKFPPGGILSGAAAVALIHHDQIKKTGEELAKDFLPLFRTRDGLIKPEVNLTIASTIALMALRW